MTFNINTCISKLEDKTYDECVKNIFGWVKQDKINPTTMNALIIISYKKFSQLN